MGQRLARVRQGHRFAAHLSGQASPAWWRDLPAADIALTMSYYARAVRRAARFFISPSCSNRRRLPCSVARGGRVSTPILMVSLSKTIFKAYDIRGIIGKTLDAGVARQIGQAFGQAALAKGERRVVIGRDGRLSGPELTAALAQGLQAAGVDVIDLGVVATPMVYFGTHVLGATSGIMVTGSHNPPDYNGFKMVLAGEAIHGDAITSLYQRIVDHDGSSAAQPGGYSTHDIRAAYLERIIGDVRPARSRATCSAAWAARWLNCSAKSMAISRIIIRIRRTRKTCRT